MVFSESGKGCMKHPYNERLPGVCPSCLREKLSQFYAKTTLLTDPSYSPSPSSSPPSSNSLRPSSAGQSSNLVSPAFNLLRHRRNGSDAVVGPPGLVAPQLRKSSSIGFGPRKGEGARKKVGFWSRLLMLKGKKRTAGAPPEPRNFRQTFV